MGNNISSCFTTNSSLCSFFSFVAGEARYIWHLEKNLEALQTELDKLIRTREDLQNEVNTAEEQPMKRRTNQVIGWLQRVQEMETEVKKLLKDGSQEVDKLCLGGFCSLDLQTAYDVGKQVPRLTDDVTRLRDERRDIRDVAVRMPEGPAFELPVDPIIVGQQSTLHQVWRYITEEQAGIIGLYGLGGVGKTTLLKQINNFFCTKQHNFDVVIWVVVSREAKLEQIQNAIGKRIGLYAESSWKSKSVEDKASDICKVLSQRNFVLLLDDIWQRIELSELGIPLQNLNVSSKILFTTRSSKVCGQMEANKTFKVKCLTEDQAWSLFEEKVGMSTINRHPRIREQAEKVARECDGLPLALITIGRTMASKKTLQEWKNAVRYLETSSSKFSGMKGVYSLLKFSYDNLPSEEYKSCLLYCSLFPEDYRIPKEDLMHYWIGEGILDDFDDGYEIIGELISSCLLEEDDDHVKMHDVIRDMALWIVRKIENEKDNFLVLAGAQLTGAPKLEHWEGVKRISLMENQIKSLQGIPNCHRLRTLLLNKNNINHVTPGFFQFMPTLRVLNLGQNPCLDRVPSGISSLVSLEYLDLSFTSIKELPEELKALVNLRYLNLEHQRLRNIPHQLLSSLSKLQVLRMLDCTVDFTRAEEDSVLFGDAEALMQELLCLEYLKVFTFTFYSSRALEVFVSSQKLLCCAQFLSLKSFHKSISLNVLPLAQMENLKCLQIKETDLEELTIDYAEQVEKVLQSGFGSLHTIYIGYCSSLMDMSWLVFAPNLKKIDIFYCDKMEEIFSVEKLRGVMEKIGNLDLFAELEFLSLVGLGNLQRIYEHPLSFTQLKAINVIGCPKLKKLPLDSNSAKERTIVIKGQKHWWTKLDWEDKATENTFLTSFQEA